MNYTLIRQDIIKEMESEEEQLRNNKYFNALQEIGIEVRE